MRGACSGPRTCISIAHEQGHQWVGADLAAPVAVDGGVKGGAFGQGVARIEKFAWTKDARAAVLQKDFHLTAQHEKPLRIAGAVEAALKAHRALAQLVTASPIFRMLLAETIALAVSLTR